MFSEIPGITRRMYARRTQHLNAILREAFWEQWEKNEARRVLKCSCVRTTNTSQPCKEARWVYWAYYLNFPSYNQATPQFTRPDWPSALCSILRGYVTDVEIRLHAHCVILIPGNTIQHY